DGDHDPLQHLGQVAPEGVVAAALALLSLGALILLLGIAGVVALAFALGLGGALLLGRAAASGFFASAAGLAFLVHVFRVFAVLSALFILFLAGAFWGAATFVVARIADLGMIGRLARRGRGESGPLQERRRIARPRQDAAHEQKHADKQCAQQHPGTGHGRRHIQFALT